MIGVDGYDFDASGFDQNFSESGSSTTLGDQGTFDSHQVIAFMKYDENIVYWGNVDSRSSCYWYYQWGNVGIVAPKSGGPAISYGNSINNRQNFNNSSWHTDGEVAMKNLLHAHPGRLRWTPWGFDDCVDHDQGVTYGFSTGLDYTFSDGSKATLKISAETDHSSSSQQCIQVNASNSLSNERRWDFHRHIKDNRHYYWGSNTGFTFGVSGANPNTFYTY